jgi:hypothetical protein
MIFEVLVKIGDFLAKTVGLSQSRDITVHHMIPRDLA